MPASGRAHSGPELLVDTSVAVALVVADHEQHVKVADALFGRRIGLAGHAAFETFSVLTRLPGPGRLSPDAATRAISANFPLSRFLSSSAAGDLHARLGALGIAGGSVYDALVAAAAVEHRVPLATRDRRASETYRAVGAELEIII